MRNREKRRKREERGHSAGSRPNYNKTRPHGIRDARTPTPAPPASASRSLLIGKILLHEEVAECDAGGHSQSKHLIEEAPLELDYAFDVHELSSAGTDQSKVPTPHARLPVVGDKEQPRRYELGDEFVTGALNCHLRADQFFADAPQLDLTTHTRCVCVTS